MDTTEGFLVLSSNRGRYAISDSEYGPDLYSSRVIEIWLGGQWVRGHVEGSARYAYEDYRPIDAQEACIDGYYFISGNGGICGLCCGMRVRTL